MLKENTRKLLIRSIAITVVASVAVFVLDIAGVFERPENMFYDSRMSKTANFVRPSDEIVVVLLDQESIDWANKEFGWGWPWARSAYGDIVRFFDMADAACVTFDVMFTEQSVYGEQDDQAFAQACKEYGKVVQTLYIDSQHGTQKGWKAGVSLPVFSDSTDAQFGYEPLLFPVDCIAKTASVLGSISGTSDADDTIRRASAYKKYGDYYIPSLGIAPLQAAGEDLPDYMAEPNEGRLLRFQSSLDSYVPYNAAQILQSYYAVQQGIPPILEPELFEGMYVFFGFYAPGLFDICTTPVSAVYPGVGVHITQLDNTLQNSFLKPSGTFTGILLMVLCALLGALPVSVAEIFHLRKFNVYAACACFVFSGVILLLFAYVLFAQGFVIPVVPPLACLVLGFGSAVVVSQRQEGKQRRYLKSAFRQYLSPAVIEDLISHPERLSLGGSRRRISIYFSDVQGFTSISEKLNPEELTSLLNDYLSAMTDIILESGGTIDKYEGDAIIAFWNAPVEQTNHAQRALEAAVKCQEKLAQMRAELEERSGMPFYMRIGLNTGDAVVGNMGSRSRFDYTMLGDSVNLAARLEGLNKQFGTYCMCSAATKEEAEKSGTQLMFRELARAAVVGKKEAVTVYEPMSTAEYSRRQHDLKKFSNALHLFYDGDFTSAKQLFMALQDADPAAGHYVKKCQELIDNPPENMGLWQGVWVATSK